MIEFHNPDQQSDRNAFGNSRELGPFRLHATQEHLNLATWREFYGFDLESVEVQVRVRFDRETLSLSLEVDGDLPTCERVGGLERDLSGKGRGTETIPGPFRDLPVGNPVVVDPRTVETRPE
jgi:hypothetical protein